MKRSSRCSNSRTLMCSTMLMRRSGVLGVSVSVSWPRQRRTLIVYSRSRSLTSITSLRILTPRIFQIKTTFKTSMKPVNLIKDKKPFPLPEASWKKNTTVVKHVINLCRKPLLPCPKTKSKTLGRARSVQFSQSLMPR